MPRVEKIKLHTKGKRKYGMFVWQDNGVAFYIAFRKHSDIYADKKGRISNAIREMAAAWAIDLTTLMAIKAKKAKYVVVKIKGQDLWYITRTENYFNRSLCKTINYSGQGGSLQRCLPLQHFKVVEGSISL